ncbi:HAD family hydrolase [Deinococcus sp.]|uniref:HAD family hydrolase n=1 Tax=Deinococcus sp. TaxID=47478 RepID=UPI003B5CFFF9
MIRAVLFDRDDTISVANPGMYLEASQWAAAQFGVKQKTVLDVMRQHWQHEFGSWWALRSLDDERAFWRRYGESLAFDLGLSAAQGEALMTQFPYHAFMQPAPGVRELLEALRARGLKIGVLSNTLPDIWPTLKAIGVDDLVDVALSSCLLGVHKPELEVFKLAANKLDLPTEQVLFFDDKPENVTAARSAGMSAELVDLTGETVGALGSLPEVLAWVEAQLT